MIDMRQQNQSSDGWRSPVVKTEAHKSLGIPELMTAILDHRDFLRQGNGQRLMQILAPRLRRELVDLVLQG